MSFNIKIGNQRFTTTKFWFDLNKPDEYKLSVFTNNIKNVIVFTLWYDDTCISTSFNIKNLEARIKINTSSFEHILITSLEKTGLSYKTIDHVEVDFCGEFNVILNEENNYKFKTAREYVVLPDGYRIELRY